GLQSRSLLPTRICELRGPADRNLFSFRDVFLFVRVSRKLLARMPFTFFQRSALFLSSAVAAACSISAFAEATLSFDKEIKPFLTKYCSDCHEDGEQKGSVSFDTFKTQQELIENHDLWGRVLKNVRMGLMPPEKKKVRPSPDEINRLADWIKYQSFHLDPANPDPGRVTLHRLNREEYRNTI